MEGFEMQNVGIKLSNQRKTCHVQSYANKPRSCRKGPEYFIEWDTV
jgi:hypothetical protein